MNLCISYYTIKFEPLMGHFFITKCKAPVRFSAVSSQQWQPQTILSWVLWLLLVPSVCVLAVDDVGLVMGCIIVGCW
ncbi:hypothetical protein BCR42DRAFT_415182 [Absidia repens]|uniref:Uncharacterized protein n=1 Tax=Absidia repens TaxID=90262 RepID=A0A1X2IHJ2_9FUNG|nr:hypothetical protein BCR42DRAFT_415182 [Absidia repens]